jgi:hypothetical protein
MHSQNFVAFYNLSFCAGLATPSSSSFKFDMMEVKSTGNQFWSKMSATWATLNLMLSLFAIIFVSADKSCNLL